MHSKIVSSCAKRHSYITRLLWVIWEDLQELEVWTNKSFSKEYSRLDNCSSGNFHYQGKIHFLRLPGRRKQFLSTTSITTKIFEIVQFTWAFNGSNLNSKLYSLFTISNSHKMKSISRLVVINVKEKNNLL